MPQITPPPVEETKDITKKFVYQRDGKKNMRQFASDLVQANKLKKEATTEPIVEDTAVAPEVIVAPATEPVVEPQGTPSETPTPQPETPALDPVKIAEDAAKKAAEITRQEFQTKIDEILNKDKDALEKQKEADDLISVFEKENRLPTDYPELVKESIRVAEARFNQLQKQQEAARIKQEQESQATQQQNTVKQQEEQMTELNKRIFAEIAELQEGKYLTKVLNASDANDKGIQEQNELLKFGVELNTERAKKNMAPVDSLTKIYFMHYKPFKEAQGVKEAQPAGANAPISGAKVTPTKEGSQRAYIYARDSKKNYRQILQEQYNRLRSS